jgi:hypothetical protein
MEFDDIINRNNRRSNSYNTHDEYRNSSYSSYSNRRYDRNYKIRYLLDSIRNNKKVKLLLIITAIVILSIIIVLFLILLPLILKLISYISQNGVQGILDIITGFLDKLWKGSGK